MKSDVTSYKGRKAGAFSSGPVQKHHKILIDEKVTSTIILALSSSLRRKTKLGQILMVLRGFNTIYSVIINYQGPKRLIWPSLCFPPKRHWSADADVKIHHKRLVITENNAGKTILIQLWYLSESKDIWRHKSVKQMYILIQNLCWLLHDIL